MAKLPARAWNQRRLIGVSHADLLFRLCRQRRMFQGRFEMMNKLAVATAVAAALTGTAYAQTPAPPAQAPQTQDQRSLSTGPTPSAQVTHYYITNYYKQNVYDSADAKIAEVTDVLVGQDGKIDGFILSVGDFLGIAEKTVAVPFDAVKLSEQNGIMRLTMDSTKDQFEKAPVFKFDTAFAQQNQSTTTGVATPGQAKVLSTIPNTTTLTSYYKKNVYDRSDSKIGEIADVLVDKDGKIDGFVMAIGGFLGIGEKNVAVPFDAVKVSQRDGSWWLTMDSTKDQFEKAPGFKYDSNKLTWVPAA